MTLDTSSQDLSDRSPARMRVSDASTLARWQASGWKAPGAPKGMSTLDYVVSLLGGPVNRSLPEATDEVIEVVIPEGANPGDLIEVTLADGRTVLCVVPADAAA